MLCFLICLPSSLSCPALVARTNKHRPRSQVWSGQIKSYQVKSGQVRSSQSFLHFELNRIGSKISSHFVRFGSVWFGSARITLSLSFAVLYVHEDTVIWMGNFVSWVGIMRCEGVRVRGCKKISKLVMRGEVGGFFWKWWNYQIWKTSQKTKILTQLDFCNRMDQSYSDNEISLDGWTDGFSSCSFSPMLAILKRWNKMKCTYLFGWLKQQANFYDVWTKGWSGVEASIKIKMKRGNVWDWGVLCSVGWMKGEARPGLRKR